MDNFKTSGSLVVFLLILVQRCIFIFCASVDRGVQVLDLERRLKQHSHQSSKHTDDAGSGGKRSDEKGRGSANMSEQRRPQNGKEFSLKSTSYAYVTSLSIGKPPQKLYFLIDTGSANTALAGPRCADQFGEKCKIDSFYRPEKSRTSCNLHTPIEAEYGKGAWSGELYKDVISFPGGSPSTMAEFAVIDHQKDFFVKNSINEGILGLAFKALATDCIEPLFDQLVKNRKVPDVFTLALCNGMGKLWLGEPDSSSYVGSLQYTHLLGPTWYTITVVGLDVGGSRVDVAPDSFPDAIVDSGTTDILLHLDAYIAVVAELKSRGPSVDARFWNGFCVKTDPYKWPYLTIYLRNTKGGSFALTILGKHYIRKQDEFYCLSIGAKQSGVVLGEVALEGNVVVFDRANKQLGFASSNITHPKSGPCGNPVTINTTVSGELSKFCDEQYMPWESCHVHCQPCVHSGGAWCPSGHVVVWINGVKSRLNVSHGFCWSGGAFSFQNEIIQTFLKGHGGVEFQIFCNSIFPMYKQCTVDSMTLFILIAAIPVVIATAFLYCISRRIIFFSKFFTSFSNHESFS